MAFSTLLFTSLFFQLSAFSFQPSAVYAQDTNDEAAAPSTELSVPAGEPAVPGAEASGTGDNAGASEAASVAPNAEPEVSTPDPEASSPEPAVPESDSADPGSAPELSGVALEPPAPSPEGAAPNAEAVAPIAETGTQFLEPSISSPESIPLTVEPTPPMLEPSVSNGDAPAASAEPASPDAESAVPTPDPSIPSGGGGAPNIEPPVPTSEPVVSSGVPAVPTAQPSAASPRPPAPGLATSQPQPESQLKFGRLSFGFVTGFYQPDISTLNGILSNRQVAILADPNYLLPGNPAFRAEARNIQVDEPGANPWLGMEAQWEFSPTIALRLTGGVWQGEGVASDNIVTFLRSNLAQIEVPRSARYNLTLDQLFLDWRYYFLNDRRRGRISLDLGIAGITLGYFTLDAVEKVVHPAAPRGGFAAVSSTETSGTAFVTRYGLAGEYFITNKLALGFSGYYLVGSIGQLKITRHFSSGFPEVPIPEPLSIRAGVPLPTTPPTPQEGQSLRYATSVTDQRGTENIGPQQDVILELDGPLVSGYVRFYF